MRAESITAAATLTARALLSVAGVPEVAAFEAEANSSLVASLVQCVLTRDPGLGCQLASDLITPASPEPNHYVGVFLGAPQLNPPAWAVADTPRLVWNLAAQRTGQLHRTQQRRAGGAATASEAQSSSVEGGPLGECATKCPVAGQLCVGSTAKKKGVCLFSTTRCVALSCACLTLAGLCSSSRTHAQPGGSLPLPGDPGSPSSRFIAAYLTYS